MERHELRKKLCEALAKLESHYAEYIVEYVEKGEYSEALDFIEHLLKIAQLRKELCSW